MIRQQERVRGGLIFIGALLLVMASACGGQEEPPPPGSEVIEEVSVCYGWNDDRGLCVRQVFSQMGMAVDEDTILFLTLCLDEPDREEYFECSHSIYDDIQEADAGQATGDPSGESSVTVPPLENQLRLSEVAVEPTDCTRDFNAVLDADGGYALSVDGQYVAGEVLVDCRLRMTTTAVYETVYDPGFIRCQSDDTRHEVVTYPVTGWGAEAITFYANATGRFQDYNGDYEPDAPPDPDAVWYPTFACILTDKIDQDVLSTDEQARCLVPGSVDPMPPDACLLGFVTDAELLAVDYTKVENTPGMGGLNE